jgi:RND family efflux transporter MFP subunit
MTHRLLSRRTGVYLLVCVALVSVAWVVRAAFTETGAHSADVETAAAAPIELAAMEVMRVERRALQDDVRVMGELRPVQHVTLRADVAATVTEVRVRAGEAVAAGDVLAVLDPRDLDSRVRERQAQLRAARGAREVAVAELASRRALADKGYASRAELDRAESDASAAVSNVTALEAQLAMAQKARSDASVTAPFAGIVASRFVEPGGSVAVNAQLFTLVALDRMEVEVGVPTSQIAQVHVGRPAELRVEGLDGERLGARVARINPMADAASRTVTVFLELENPSGSLRGGMFTSGRIAIARSDDAIGVPATALREDAVGAYVLTIEAGVLTRRAVVPGRRWGGGETVEIERGLEASDVVVSAVLPGLRPGMRVTVDAR